MILNHPIQFIIVISPVVLCPPTKIFLSLLLRPFSWNLTVGWSCCHVLWNVWMYFVFCEVCAWVAPFISNMIIQISNPKQIYDMSRVLCVWNCTELVFIVFQIQRIKRPKFYKHLNRTCFHNMDGLSYAGRKYVFTSSYHSSLCVYLFVVAILFYFYKFPNSKFELTIFSIIMLFTICILHNAT